MKKHRLIITGVTGTLGSNLLKTVAAWSNATTLALIRSNARPEREFSHIHYKRVDFLCRQELAEVIKQFQPTSLIHCAAGGMRFPRPGWFDLIHFNVDTTLHLCEIVSQIHDCQFVYISSGLAYRDQGRCLREIDPLDSMHPYGASKAAADILMRAAAVEFEIPMVVLRPFSFSGVADRSTRLFPALLRAAAEKRPFNLSPGDQIRDHCAVGDIVQGITQSILHGSEFGASLQVFNLGSSNKACLKDFLQDVVKQIELDVELNFGACDYIRFEPKHLVADISHAEKLLGWKPQINFAYAVWELAREDFPSLKLKKPKASL